MKIESEGLNRLVRKEAEGAAPLEKGGQSNESAAVVDRLGGKDKATLSEKAILLSKARKALDEVPEVRQEKVDELRESVETGNYKVPLEDVVKRMVSQVKID